MKKLTFLLLSAILLAGGMIPTVAQSSYVRTYQQTSAPYTSATPAAMYQCSNGNLLAAWNNYFFGYATLTRIDATGYAQWSITLGDGNSSTSHEVYSIGENTDGSLWVFGSSRNSNGIPEYHLSELSQAGVINWTKFYYATDEYAYVTPSCHKMYDGGYMMNLSVSSHLQLLRTDADGNLMWGQVFKTDSSQYKHPGFAGAPTYDGGFVMSGKDGSNSCLVKVNLNGGVDWGFSWNPWNNAYCHTKDVCQLNDGSIIAGGYIDNLCFLLKVDISGSISWIKTFGIGTAANPSVYRIHPLADGSFLACGAMVNSFTNSGDFMLKMDSDGNLIGAMLHTSNYASLSYALDGRTMVNQSNELFVLQNTIAAGNPIELTKIGAGFESGCNTTPISVAFTSLPVPAMSSLLRPVWTANDGIEVTGNTLSAYAVSLTVSSVCVATGVTEPVQSSEVSVYPNPSAAGNVLRFNAAVAARWTITDAAGRTVQEGRAQPGNNILPELTLSSGMYLFRLVNDNGDVLTQQKLIRE
jgi:hypothetical protein